MNHQAIFARIWVGEHGEFAQIALTNPYDALSAWVSLGQPAKGPVQIGRADSTVSASSSSAHDPIVVPFWYE
jgi:hypothetical protein